MALRRVVEVRRRLAVCFDVPFNAGPVRYEPIRWTLWAGCYPGHDNDSFRESMSILRSFGVNRMVDLTEEDELTTAGEKVWSYHARLTVLASPILQRPVVRSERFAVRDDCAPGNRVAVGVCRAIDEAVRAGERTYLHCRGGVGRTATMVAAYLLWSGLAGERDVLGVLDRMRRYESRPAPMPAQVDWLFGVWIPYVKRMRRKER